MNKDVTANNIAYVTSDPVYAITRFFASNQAAPVGVNWSYYTNPEVDKLSTRSLNTFDAAKQDALLAKVHEKVVDDAVLIWVCARHQPARAVAQDQVVRPGPALVPGPDDDRRLRRQIPRLRSG